MEKFKFNLIQNALTSKNMDILNERVLETQFSLHFYVRTKETTENTLAITYINDTYFLILILSKSLISFFFQDMQILRNIQKYYVTILVKVYKYWH